MMEQTEIPELLLIHSDTESDRVNEDFEKWLMKNPSQGVLFDKTFLVNLILFSVDSANCDEFNNTIRALKPEVIIDSRLSPQFRISFGSVEDARKSFNELGIYYIRIPIDYTEKEDLEGNIAKRYSEIIKKYFREQRSSPIVLLTASDYQHDKSFSLLKKYCQENNLNVNFEHIEFDSFQTGYQKKKLLNILQTLYNPCRHISKICSDTCTWIPKAGFVPSGFGGAIGCLSNVKLVIVAAEPGAPVDGAIYTGSPIEMFEKSISIFGNSIANKEVVRNGRKFKGFHNNMGKLLNYFWEDIEDVDKLRQTWFTNSVLCPVKSKKYGGTKTQHNKFVEETCIKNYLKPQLKLFNDPFILALGDKARDRMQENDIDFHTQALHPSSRKSEAVKEKSWQEAALEFHNWKKARFYWSGSES